MIHEKNHIYTHIYLVNVRNMQLSWQPKQRFERYNFATRPYFLQIIFLGNDGRHNDLSTQTQALQLFRHATLIAQQSNRMKRRLPGSASPERFA